MLTKAAYNLSSKQSGFTMVEVLIAVVLIGIIAGIGLPSYTAHTKKVRRADAKVTLMNEAQALERCNIEYDAYNDSSCPSTLSGGGTITTPEGYYSIEATTLSATAFTLTATPVSGKGQDSDSYCTSFTLTQAGAQGATGSDTTNCW